MTIHHIVLSGGGPVGFISYGVLSYLHKKTFWNIQNIKTIYGTSIGAFIGTILSLNFSFEIIDDYLIKRPWEKLIDIGPEEIFNIVNKKGIFDKNFVIHMIKPLLSAKELSIDVTLQELFEYNHIDIHMYAVDLNENEIKQHDISYKSHPKLSLVDALHATMAFPLLISPCFIEKKCLIDGGLVNNFPLQECLQQTNCEHDEVIALKNNCVSTPQNILTLDSKIITIIIQLMTLLYSYIWPENKQYNMKNIIYCNVKHKYNYLEWINSTSNKNKRKKLIKAGHKLAKKFLKNY
jgi:predicted acylesterase/phospholipase RssA